MKRFAVVVLFLCLTAGFALQANAQGDEPWQVQYWNNVDLSGSPVVTRNEINPNYVNVSSNWAPGVATDNFSARFEKYVRVATPATYRFRVTADDGVRIFVDGQNVLNQWKEQGPTTYVVDTNLTAGDHLVRVEYYDRTQYATLQLSFDRLNAPATATATRPAAPTATSTPGAANAWKGEFWTNNSLSGVQQYTAFYNAIDFNWGTGSPSNLIPADNFSARFTRTISVQQGTYRFNVTADDGVRLYVNNRLLINQWRNQPPTTYYYDIFLPTGNAEVRVEYYEATQGASLRMSIGSPTASPTVSTKPTNTPLPPVTPTGVPGEVIVDDTSAGFITGGPPSGFGTEAEGYGGRLTWTRNNDVQRTEYNFARWFPTLTARRYEVFAYIPDRFTTTRSAKYYISHRDGLATVTLDQSAFSEQWVSLGTYNFTGTPGDYVSLSDVTGERIQTTLIAFDALKFVPR